MSNFCSFPDLWRPWAWHEWRCKQCRQLAMLNCWNCCWREVAWAGDSSPDATTSPSREGDGGDGECVNQCGEPAAGLSWDGARGEESLGPGDDDVSCGDRWPTAYRTWAGAYCSDPVSVTNDGTAAFDCWAEFSGDTGVWAVVTAAALFIEPYCVRPYTAMPDHSLKPQPLLAIRKHSTACILANLPNAVKTFYLHLQH